MNINPDQHLGHMIFNCFKSRPDAICHIDAATEESETNASVLSRTIRLAQSLRAFGLVPGDVLAIGGRRHVDLHIPYYAALLNGFPMLGIDPFHKYEEIKHVLEICAPKIAFCDPDIYEHFSRACQELHLDIKLVTFGNGDNRMNKFIEEYQPVDSEDSFEVAKLEPDNYIWLTCTSGTTGLSKIAASTYRNWFMKTRAFINFLIKARGEKSNGISDNAPNKPVLNLASISWVSGTFNSLSMPLLRQCMVQTSAPITTEHVIDIINKYKPVYALLSPSIVTYILKNENKCDLSSFETLIIGGAKTSKELIIECKKRMNEGVPVVELLGQTETLGMVLLPTPTSPVGSCGKPFSKEYLVKLVDPSTEEEIREPYVTGELWTKGANFACYYKNPEETEKMFKDGWLKTGDLLYRNEHGDYFFVDRLKMMIKYQNYHVIPREVEEVIRRHPGVLDVAVSSIPHPEDSEHPVACVVRRPGSQVTAQEIKQLVAEHLSSKNQLRGGVIFLDAIPMTPSAKTKLPELKKLILTAQRE